MKRTVRLMLLLALLATAASSFPVSSHAQSGDLAGSVPTAGISGPTEDRWWGAAASAACGFGMRGWVAMGWNLGYNALLTVVCFTALLDAVS